MRNKAIFQSVLTCVILVVLPQFLLAEAALEKVTVKKNLTYATVGETELKLDLYLPTAVENPYLVVWIHGGGWGAGNRYPCHVSWLAEKGYAVASISYRLVDVAIFPAQIHDCKAAVRWLRAHSGEYGYQSETITVAGESAGGHLAMLLGMSGGSSELEGRVGDHLDQSSRVELIVDYYGASDFILRSKTQPSRANAEGSVVYKLLGGGADQLVDKARLASPVTYVSPDDPPLLIFHGAADSIVLPDQAERIHQAYGEAGLPVEMHMVEDGQHGARSWYEGRFRSMLEAYLGKHLVRPE